MENPLPSGNRELVLVVDDEERMRIVVQSTLERFGYRVLLAANGAEAVALYAQNREQIAIVLTDMAMPVMDGPATIVALKSMNPNLKIIASSGLPSDGDVAEAAGAGVKHFVPKPYTTETLLNILAEALREGSGKAASVMAGIKCDENF
jgi:CheY-like chemotaxis protein